MTHRVWFALLALVPLPAASFLIQDGYFQSSDGMIHLYRLFELDRALREGILFPRWFPLSGYGYGLPVFNYYPPLAYYLAEIFNLLGAGYIGAIKLLIVACLLIAAFAMFFFARDLIGDAPAFVASVAFAHLPYTLSDAYVRGNFPELLALSLIPLALFTFRRAFETGTTRAMIFAALAFAAIVLAHHLTAMQFAGLLLAYLIWLFIFESRSKTFVLRRSPVVGFAIILGLALSAFYWLPALAELNLALVGPGSLARFLVSRLVTLADFFAPALAYVYVPQTEVLKHSAGFPQTSLALFSIFLLVVIRNSPLAIRNHHIFFFITLVASIIMTLDFSAPLWYAIPTLRFMQFPWRFQILVGISVAFLIGVWVHWLKHFRIIVPAFAFALMALSITNLPVRAFPLTDAQIDLTRTSDSDYVLAQMGWGWTREFVPATVRDSENVSTPIAKANVVVREWHTLPRVQVKQNDSQTHTFHTNTSESFELSLAQFYFPRWQAYIDGTRADTYPRGTLGLATVNVPPGEHTITFRFENTLLRDVASFISALALFAIAVWWFVEHRRIALGIFVVAILLFAIFVTQPRAPAPIAISANLDNQAMLVGYASERMDNSLRVTLYWLALNEMQNDYTSFVHLLDETDAVIAQHDGQPNQGLMPTTRWLAGEIIPDRHVITFDGIAPHHFRLAAGMYLANENSFTSLGDVIELK